MGASNTKEDNIVVAQEASSGTITPTSTDNNAHLSLTIATLTIIITVVLLVSVFWAYRKLKKQITRDVLTDIKVRVAPTKATSDHHAPSIIIS
jgi:hypothetical protein